MKLPSTYRVTIPYRIQQLIFKKKMKKKKTKIKNEMKYTDDCKTQTL